VNISRFERPVSLVPFGYLLVSRGKNPWDLLYMLGNSWIPGVYLIVRLGGLDPMRALLAFVLGYLAFISCYEIGYLANDCWDAARTSGGRRRIQFAVTPLYVALFTAIRLTVWLLIGVSTGWILEIAWAGGYVALVAAFALHNVLQSPSVRIGSFLQLSILRFVLPLIGALRPGTYLLAFAIALLFYTLFRLLSYLDSKDLLSMSEPRTGRFKLAVVAVETPIALYLSFLSQSTVIAETLVYYLILYGLISLRESANVSGRARMLRR
jgi:hypothetical protein